MTNIKRLIDEASDASMRGDLRTTKKLCRQLSQMTQELEQTADYASEIKDRNLQTIRNAKVSGDTVVLTIAQQDCQLPTD